MKVSTARIDVERPERYVTRMCRHFGHRLPVEFTKERGSIRFDVGTCLLSTGPNQLVLHAEAEDDERLGRLESVVGRHLERFGTEDELQVRWTHDSEVVPDQSA
jgi:hypothetical protein